MSTAHTCEQPACKPASGSGDAATYLKMILCTLFWGGTFIAGRVISADLPAFSAAAARFAIAAVLLVGICILTLGTLPRLGRRELAATAALGLTGIFLNNVFFFSALQLIPAGRAALFVALTPAITVVFGALLLRTRLQAHKWAGIALALAGAVIVITHGNVFGELASLRTSFGPGEMLMLGGPLSWAAYTLIGQRALARLTPLVATTYAALWGLALLVAGAAFETAAVEWSSVPLRAWGWLAYLGVGTAISYKWWNDAVKQLGTARAAVFNNLVPVFGVCLGALLLGEQVLVSMVAGGLLVIAGVTVTNGSLLPAGLFSRPVQPRR